MKHGTRVEGKKKGAAFIADAVLSDGAGVRSKIGFRCLEKLGTARVASAHLAKCAEAA